MNIRLLICLGLLLLFSSTRAQVFKEGHLVLHSGDTLRGLVAWQTENTFAYKPDKKGSRNLYHVKDLAGYSMGEDSYEQHTVEVLRGNFPEKVQAYLRVVEDGPLRLLEYTGENIYGGEHVNYFLHNGYDTPYRVNRNPGNFRSTMKIYFRENVDLAHRIRSKELSYDHLPVIVRMYNAWYIEREQNSVLDPVEGEESEESGTN